MKKKIWIPIVIVVVILAILFVPIPQAPYDDGGTREWVALTYKIVDWNKITDDGLYENTSIYFGEERWQDIDQLWLKESEKVEHEFRAIITNIDGSWVNVKPVDGRRKNTTALILNSLPTSFPILMPRLAIQLK